MGKNGSGGKRKKKKKEFYQNPRFDLCEQLGLVGSSLAGHGDQTLDINDPGQWEPPQTCTRTTATLPDLLREQFFYYNCVKNKVSVKKMEGSS